MKNQWTDLHHQVFHVVKKHNFEKSTFLVACSGGLDSVAGFYLLKELGLQVEISHIHHGGSSDYRRQAKRFVEKIAAKEDVPFYLVESSQTLARENEMREFRRKVWRPFLKTHVVTLSHQKEDLMETRMMRLIRGTGPDGLLSMTHYQGFLFRPLLGVSKTQLREFLLLRKIAWLEDPSNQDPRYFRNFLRKSWFPMLEKQKPGSLARLSESLENLVHSSQRIKGSFTSLSLTQYLCMSEKEQLQALALLLKNNGYHQFGLSQLKEIQKRLDKDQKLHTFKCAGVHWLVNAQQISLEK